MTLSKDAETNNRAGLNPRMTQLGGWDPEAQRVPATIRPVTDEDRDHYVAVRRGGGGF